MIAGDHDHADAGGVAAAYRLGNTFARRVEQPDQAGKDQLGLLL